MILFIAGSIYIPALFVSAPRYDFLYTTGYDYYDFRYEVQNSKLIKIPLPASPYPSFQTPAYQKKLYLHETGTNTNREISFEQAELFTLDTSLISPDGYEITYSSNGGGFFPFYISGSNNSGYYLTGHNLSKKINLGGTDFYTSQFTFLGWVKK